MPELGGTITFVVPGVLSLEVIEAIHGEIKAMQYRERLPATARLSRLVCQVEGDSDPVTRCLLRWEFTPA